jgi:cytochrome c biogenesis factor
MLQHNGPGPDARPAHLAHAALISLHALCCGLPALALAAAAISGAAAGTALHSGSIRDFHAFMHVHEVWIMIASAVLVLIGGALEFSARRRGRRHGFSWLFAVSALCFLANVVIIVSHRG